MAILTNLDTVLIPTGGYYRLRLHTRVRREGARYVIAAKNLEIQHVGWHGPVGPGYHVDHYFTADGRYLGPDKFGVEPLFEIV